MTDRHRDLPKRGSHADADEPAPDSSDVAESSEGVLGDDGPAMPRGYGEDKLVAMPRGPDSLFVYWDLTGSESARIRRRIGGACEWILRVSDAETGWRRDTPVDPQAGDHYLKLKPGGRYVIQIGITATGAFHPVCRSIECRLAPDEPRSCQVRSAAPGCPAGASMPGLAYDPAAQNASSSSPHTCHGGR